MAFAQQLRVPGPTPLPERVVRAAGRPMINHRGPEFAALLRDVEEGLRWALRTDNDVLIYPCSGTGGLEAAVVNLLSQGEQALFCTMGSFGERWADIATAYGADVLRLRVAPGEPIDPEDVERILAEHPGVTTVFVTHNETSTGVTNDLPAIAAVVKGRGKLLAVELGEWCRLHTFGDRRLADRRAHHRFSEGMDGASRRHHAGGQRGGIRAR